MTDTDASLAALRQFYRHLVHSMMGSGAGPVDPTMIGEVGRYMHASIEKAAMDRTAVDVCAWVAFTSRLTELGFSAISMDRRKGLQVSFGTAPFDVEFIFTVRDEQVSDCRFVMYLPKPPYRPNTGNIDNPKKRLVGQWRWGRKALGEGVHLVEEIEPDMAKVIWGK